MGMFNRQKGMEAMGATEILRQDHAKVRKIFDEFESTEESAAKRRLVETCLIELTIHSKLEEELFYPAARKHSDEDIVDEAEEEHHVAKLLIAELSTMTPSDKRYDAKFTVLSDSIRHHIEEEEGEMFPSFEKSGVDLQTLGQEMMERKQNLMQEVTLDSIRQELSIEVSGEIPSGGRRSGRTIRGKRGGRRMSRRASKSKAKA